ncbi:MAG: type I restriction-modification system subunit M [Chitinophagaceae bacterium]|jgi:type I restriction enzyme M protein|nr:type I restriction-modification system subunit M [Chitinophagaceae bacterium]OQY96966.1 MAG: type I restriction-modification system subunit M [Sphingobacteriales bacterium UTBCD1]
MNKITQKDINDAVWKACDTFRGSIDPSVYKDYVLTMLFLKYLSDVHDDKMEGYLAKYNGDMERAKRAMQHERFIVPEHSHFKYLYDHRNEANIGELINIALTDLEEANREKLYSEDGAGIFQNIDFNSSKLGEPKDKNQRLKTLLIDFNSEKLDLRPSHLGGADIIGGAYEFLIANFASDAGKKAGEFFTPAEVSTLLAKLTKSKPGSRICDPTCGSGSLLIKAGNEVGSDNFSLYGQEANGSTWALAVMNMFLHGFDNATIRWGDTIRNPKLKEGDQLMKFDTVVANPPFSLDKWGKVEDKDGDKTTISYDPETDKYNRFWRGVPPKSKGDWAFISHMIETLNEHGKAGVVVPHGVLFRGSSEGRIRQRTIEENLLEAVIGLPANLFFGTGIPAAILVFNKQKTSNNFLFIDASKHYESAKNQNKLRDSDIKRIVATYKLFSEKLIVKNEKLKAGEEGRELGTGKIACIDGKWINDQNGDFSLFTSHSSFKIDKYSYVATAEEIQENDFNLNIPRYVDTFEEEAEVDIAAVQMEIDKLEDELAKVQAEINQYLKQLTV